MQYFVYLTLLVYFGVGSLLQGFYQQLSFLIVNVVLFGIAVLVLAWKRNRLTEFHLILLLFVLCYWVSVGFAVDREQAVLEAMKVSGLLPLSVSVTALSKERLSGLLKSWMWIGVGLTCWGVLFGMYRNNRLESTFDYANTLAVVLLAGVLLAVFFYLQEASFINLLAMTVNGTGLLLTLSRSVWVLWILSIGACLLLFPKLRERNILVRIGISHVSSLLLAMLIRLDPLFFWQRVQSLNLQASEFKIRLVYWYDSLRMIRDYWLTGAGGGGWSVLFYQYRSQDYFVKYVHNQYLQILLDTGIIGLILFLLLVGLFYYRVFQCLRSEQEDNLAKIRLLLVTVLLLHAGFDVDFTFPLVFGMLICLMAVSFRDVETGKMLTNNESVKLSPIKICVNMIFTLFLLGSLWLTFGYAYKLNGISFGQHGKWDEAFAQFSKAEKIMPWSDTVHYEAAKLYVLLGNQTKNVQFYQRARTELEAAQKLVPEQSLYQMLLKQLP